MHETRKSRAGDFVAIRNRPGDANPWSVSNGTFASDAWVADWTPLAPAPADDGTLTRELKVEVQLVLNRSTTRTTPHVAHIEIMDTLSRMTIMEIHLTAEEFHQFMAGRTPGGVDGVLADVATPHLLARVGKTMNNFSEVFPYLTDEAKLAGWAVETAAAIEVPAGTQITTNVKRVRDGVRATWRAYGDMSPDDITITSQRLSAAADDFKAGV
jgi:hypothetical protein